VRAILPGFLRMPAMMAFVAVCATSRMHFNLFSFLTYVPALQTGAAGVLLLLVGVALYARTGALTPGLWLAITGGAFLAAYSKPESLLAAGATLGVLAALDRNYWFDGRTTKAWLRHYGGLAAACTVPALAAYVWTGSIAGFAKMLAGITGYGLAGSACPWWPTGYGIFGALSALGEAAAIAAVFSLTRRRRFRERFGRKYGFFLAAGAAGALLFGVYVFSRNWELLTGSRPITEKIWYSGPSTVWTSAMLLPVMWTSVALWAYLAWRTLARRMRTDAGTLELLLLLTGPVCMSTRGWFTSTLDVHTDVPGICYPFFLLLGPYLLWRFLELAGPGPDLQAGNRDWPGAALTALFLAIFLLRMAGSADQWNAPYVPLSTLAGEVRSGDIDVDSEIYRFVMANTSPSDLILDVPYGGGMNVATRRASPLFETQFRFLSPSEEILRDDLDRIQRHPPKLVIAQNEPDFGASFGLRGCSCAFPRLVWKPERIPANDGKRNPALDYVAQNYRVAKVVGPKQILLRK